MSRTQKNRIAEKIEPHRDDLKELAESDLPVSEYAALLLELDE